MKNRSQCSAFSTGLLRRAASRQPMERFSPIRQVADSGEKVRGIVHIALGGGVGGHVAQCARPGMPFKGS